MISRVVRTSFARTTSLAVASLAMMAGTVIAQEIPGRVSGTVTSAEEGGQPIYGVNIIVKGTTTGTITAANGRYSLPAQPNDTLIFRFLGYAPQEIAVAGRAIVNAAMQPVAVALQDIVVVGYGTQQRRDVTGAVASVSGSELTEVATPSVAQALQGRVAGVQVTPQSGEPGASAVIRIRGTGTLNNASPLFVVDGMLLDDINFLAPNDIQSVEVLKDASATAIYGSRGANGVIIVTTKKGAIEGPVRFTINAYAGTQRVLDPIDLVNARQYAMLANELAVNTGVPRYFPDENAVGAGTDWQDVIFENAPIQSYQLSSSGGTDRITYYFSGNFFRQAGIIPRSDFDRLTLRLNNDYQLNERLQLGHNISFSYTDGLRPPGVLGALYRADPTISPVNADGSFADASVRASAGNPAATVFYTNNDEEARRLVGNAFADLNLLENITFRTSFGLDYNQQELREFVPVFFVSPTQRNVDSDLLVRNDQVRSWLWENTLNWNWASDRHRVSALGGITWQSFYADSLGGRRVNIVGNDPNLWFLEAGDAAGQTNFNRGEDWRMLSYLARANYSFLERYLLTASIRVDGSSRFGSENRYGYFPSFALGWNIAEEPFFPAEGFIDALKLRASWGEIGNDKIGAYPGIPVVSGNLNAVFGPSEQLTFGASPFELANPEVKWEETRQTNIGADMAFFGGRLEAIVDYYNRLTEGILVRVPIPLYVGVGTEPFVNAAQVENKGLEGSFTWSETRGDFRYEFNINGSTINNEVKKLAQGREQILGGGLGNEITFTTRTVVGQPIGSFWGFRVAGVFQDSAEITSSPRRGGERPGDLRFADLNGDGTITDADKTFIGSPIPDLVYGLSTRLSWGRFDLSASFSGVSGNEVFNGKKAVRFGVENFETSYLNRWRGPGTSNREPRVTTAGHNYQASDRFIEDGSFFKLNAAQLGFRLPESLTARARLQTARIYVNGTNLFNVTDYSGYTPELTVEDVIRTGIDLGVFPPARTITLGLDVNF
jgi:TonB-linked SusC/RagA family outer membrane protein